MAGDPVNIDGLPDMKDATDVASKAVLSSWQRLARHLPSYAFMITVIVLYLGAVAYAIHRFGQGRKGYKKTERTKKKRKTRFWGWKRKHEFDPRQRLLGQNGNATRGRGAAPTDNRRVGKDGVRRRVTAASLAGLTPPPPPPPGSSPPRPQRNPQVPMSPPRRGSAGLSAAFEIEN